MKKIVLLLFILSSLDAFAQDTLNSKCWTPELDTTEFQNQPWFSNNDYLEHFLDSIGYPAAGTANRIVGAPQVRFWIPIKFWIYRNDDGTGGPTQRQIQTMMDNLNRRFNQTNNAWIGFYMKCAPTFVNNSTHVNKNFTGASLLMGWNNDHGSINIHVISSFHSNALGFAISNLNACMVPSDSYLFTRNNGDLAHEVGHILGLQHTHQYSALDVRCLTESVSRTRTWPTLSFCPTRLISNRVCEATGDGLRDTQADNNLAGNSACFYNVNFGDDEWGDSYDNPPAGLQDRPNIRNIMSYNTATDCVDQISRLQIGVMLWTLYFKKTTNLIGWTNPISTFDNFEPDNDPIVARNIQLNQVQERNFHQQWNRVGGYFFTTQCDVDWVRFIAPCNSNLEVFTSAMQNRTNANTRLTLFDNNLVQLAQNDDISTTNQFSSIQFNFIQGQEYFIRIENVQNLVTSYYNLQIGPTISITGNSAFCNSESFTVNNLPAGATVTWSATPTGLVSFNPQGPTTNPTTTVTKIAAGNVTINATVNTCNTLIEAQKPILTENLPLVDYLVFTNGIQENGFFCSSHYGNEFEVITSPSIPSNGALEYRILSWPNFNVVYTHPNPVALGNPIPVYYTPSPGWYVIEVKITTPCGSTDWIGYEVEYVDCLSYGRNQYFTINASPNPTSSDLYVTIDKEKAEVKALSSTENVKYILYDLNRAKAIKQWTFYNDQKQRRLNVSGVRAGQYILVVTIGKYRQSTQIIIR